MKTKCGLFYAILACLLLVVIIPQVSGADSKSGSDGDPKTVSLIMKTLTNPFFIEMEKGARRAEKELGIRLLVKTGAKETSIDQQIAIVEDMIRQRISAIVIAPGSSTDLFLYIQCSGIPACLIKATKSSIKPSICAPPVTALRKPWSSLPPFFCLLCCRTLVFQ